MFEWTDDVEHLLEQMRQNCVYLNKFHKQRYFYYQQLVIYFKLPTIIISSFASIASVNLTAYLSQSDTSSIVCLMTLCVSILNSIELFLKINETTILELETSKSYYQLSLSIHRVLKLQRENRKISGMDALEKFYRDYTELYESSALISKSYPDKLVDIEKKKFSFLKKTGKSISSGSSSTSLNQQALDDLDEEEPSPQVIINQIQQERDL